MRSHVSGPIDIIASWACEANLHSLCHPVLLACLLACCLYCIYLVPVPAPRPASITQPDLTQLHPQLTAHVTIHSRPSLLAQPRRRDITTLKHRICLSRSSLIRGSYPSGIHWTKDCRTAYLPRLDRITGTRLARATATITQ
jgi:hypothetical protein